MKCLIIGICQLNAITHILKNNSVFTSVYDEIISHVIFQLTETEMFTILEKVVPQMDLILSQPVSETYKNNNIYSTRLLRNAIKPGAKHYIVTNCYFTGYDPLPFQLVQDNGEILNHINTYYPLLAFDAILNHDHVKAAIQWCNPKNYNNNIIQNNVEQSLQELEKREAKVFDEIYGVDIVIVDFIRNNYQQQYLFHTYNHPTNVVLLELTKRILNKLNLPVLLDNYTEFLGDTSWPPCPAVYIKLNCTFTYPKIIINSKCYETRDAMKYLISDIEKLDHNLYSKWQTICIEKFKCLNKYDY